MKVCIGGTFSPLHDGHKTLIKKSIEVAGKNGYLFIGISEGILIKNRIDVMPFEQRKKEIEKLVKKINNNLEIEIKPIYDKFGPSIEKDFDAIVVSPETKKTAIEINKVREKIGKKPLEIITIPFLLAKDKKPISSTRIRKKEIDESGKILTVD